MLYNRLRFGCRDDRQLTQRPTAEVEPSYGLDSTGTAHGCTSPLLRPPNARALVRAVFLMSPRSVSAHNTGSDIAMSRERMLRLPKVVERTGLSTTTLWRRERAGLFPKRRRLGPNSVGWMESEVNEWLRSLPLAAEEPPPDAT